MSQIVSAILFTFAVGIALVLLTVKLRLFDRSTAAGRLSLFSGGLILFLSACWQVARSVPDYSTWFVDEAYTAIDFGQALFSIVGLVLLAVGIFRFIQHWQMRTREVNAHEMRLSLLAELQDKARNPYHLLELLDIGIKEIVSNLTECSGAIFLINRPRRQFILGSSVGFSREEVVGLEHYRMESNAVSQSLELGEPLLSGAFEMYDRDGHLIPSRFRSTIILPMISGMDKVGGIILVSSKERRFGGRDVRLLMPVADWLAEKVKSARLSRELTQLRNESDKLGHQREALMTRLSAILSSAGEGDALDAVCSKLVGVAGCKAAYVFGVSNGVPVFQGGSEANPDLSENYKTALLEALEKGKPLIVNQEGKTEDGRTVVIRSSLVVPFGASNQSTALLLVRDTTAFKLGADDLDFVLLLSRLVSLVSRQVDNRRLDLTRRKGFEHIIGLLQSKKLQPVDEDPTYLIRHLSEVLPPTSIALALKAHDTDTLTVEGTRGASSEQLGSLHLVVGEGFIGRVFNSAQSFAVTGRYSVARELEQLGQENRRVLAGVFAETGAPGFLCAVPTRFDGRIRIINVFFMSGMSDDEASEWRRLLSLAGELYSLALTLSSLMLAGRRPPERPQVGAEVRNQLNNHLSAILGYAELAFTQSAESSGAREKLDSIITEAQKAADIVRDRLSSIQPGDSASSGATAHRDASGGVLMDSILRQLLQNAHISDNLYMIAGQPREVIQQVETNAPVTVARAALVGAFEGALVKLASLGADDDFLRVSSYRHRESPQVYVDIIRQRKGMAPPDRIAGFAEYQSIDGILRDRPYDSFLNPLAQSGIAVAIDRFSPVTTWFSFRFPILKGEAADKGGERTPSLRILAIDDQQVILDLITAMCQSLGYEVAAAGSGEKGISLASQQPFDIVLTDFAMPGLSGLETAREIRRLQPEVPIVLVTGWEGHVDSAQLAEAGIEDVLYKPFRIEQLTDLITAKAASRTIG